MAETPVNNWPTPDDTDRLSAGAAAIRALADAIDASQCSGIAEATWSASGAADRSLNVVFPSWFTAYIDDAPGTVIVPLFMSATNGIWLRHFVSGITRTGFTINVRGLDTSGSAVTFRFPWQATAVRP
jgi:hypothetical protein